MRLPPGIVLVAVALASAAVSAAAAPGLGLERFGLGLKPPSASTPWSGGLSRTAEPPGLAAAEGEAVIIYGGTRDPARLQMRGAESYVGFYQPFSDTWGASVELGVMQSGPLALRRYSLASQLQTAFAGGSSLSVGLKYRVYEPDPGLRPYADMLPNGYTLVPGRVPGVSYGPSYQFNLNYQYSAAHAFALALGRELETFTPAFDLPGGARQFSLTGEHWLTPSWALSYDLLSTDPSNAFRFQGLRFGVRYRF